jgi:hypothetical protein
MQLGSPVLLGRGFKYGELFPKFRGVLKEMLKYGYGSCTTQKIEWLHYKVVTRPLVREGALQESSSCQGKQKKRKEKKGKNLVLGP